MAEGGPKLKNQWGSNKIEVVPICLVNPHVHGEIQIQKKYFVPPPYVRMGHKTRHQSGTIQADVTGLGEPTVLVQTELPTGVLRHGNYLQKKMLFETGVDRWNF